MILQGCQLSPNLPSSMSIMFAISHYSCRKVSISYNNLCFTCMEPQSLTCAFHLSNYGGWSVFLCGLHLHMEVVVSAQRCVCDWVRVSLSSSPQSTMATPDYEPQPQDGHALVEYNGCTYLIGGEDSNKEPIDPSTVAILDPVTLKWQRRTTTGTCICRHWHLVPCMVCCASNATVQALTLSAIIIYYTRLSK